MLQITDSINSLLEILDIVAILSLISLIVIFYIREAIYASDYSDEKEKHCMDNIREITKKISIFMVTAFLTIMMSLATMWLT